MPTFVSVSEEILDDRNGCNTQKNPLEINKKKRCAYFSGKYPDLGLSGDDRILAY